MLFSKNIKAVTLTPAKSNIPRQHPLNKYKEYIENDDISKLTANINDFTSKESAKYLYDKACELFYANRLEDAASILSALSKIKLKDNNNLKIKILFSLTVVLYNLKDYEKALIVVSDLAINHLPDKSVNQETTKILYIKIDLISTNETLIPIKNDFDIETFLKIKKSLQIIFDNKLLKEKEKENKSTFISIEESDCAAIENSLNIQFNKKHKKAINSYAIMINIVATSTYLLLNEKSMSAINVIKNLPANIIDINEARNIYIDRIKTDYVEPLFKKLRTTDHIETMSDEFELSKHMLYREVAEKHQTANLTDDQIKYCIMKNAIGYHNILLMLSIYKELVKNYSLPTKVKENIKKRLVPSNAIRDVLELLDIDY